MVKPTQRANKFISLIKLQLYPMASILKKPEEREEQPAWSGKQDESSEIRPIDIIPFT